MNLGTDVATALYLPQAEIPLELQRNFSGIRHIPLFYANYVRKLNHKRVVQTRVLLCTIDNVYVCHPNGDIVRCVPFAFIEAIYHDPDRRQMAFVIPREYDILFSASDTYHILHVIQTLRSMHSAEKPLTVRTLVRPKAVQATVQDDQNRSVVSMDEVASSTGSTGPRKSDGVPPDDSHLWKPERQKPHRKMTLLESLKSKLGIGGPRAGVIIGWNDQFLDTDDPTGAAVVGHPNEVCIGKNFYAVNLVKPPEWKLDLHERGE